MRGLNIMVELRWRIHYDPAQADFFLISRVASKSLHVEIYYYKLSFFDSEQNCLVISSFLMVTVIFKSSTRGLLWFIAGRVGYSQWTYETSLAAGQANWFTVMKGSRLSTERAIMKKHPGTANYISHAWYVSVSSTDWRHVRFEKKGAGKMSCRGARVLSDSFVHKVSGVS